MAGFLDKNSRVVDFILTAQGKKKLSQGKLNFKFYTFFDDGIDYDSYVENSSSLSNVALTESKLSNIDETLVFEPVYGLLDERSNNRTEDNLNLKSQLFTKPLNLNIIPEFSINNTTGSFDIGVEQSNVKGSSDEDVGFVTSNSTNLNIEFKISDFFEEFKQKGVLIKLFHSSSSGLRQVLAKRDFNEVVSYGAELIAFVDEEIDELNDERELKEFLEATEEV